MYKIKLIQIGDIHYPDSKAKKLADIKDHGLPEVITSRVTTKPLQSVFRKIKEVSEQTDGLIFCGDLTSKGDILGYKQCLQYIDNILGISKPPWNHSQIHAVPGNHDIDRGQCDDPLDLYKKFDPFSEAWADISLNILTTRSHRKTEISNNKSKAIIFSLNSCLGCGEKRYLPKEISEELKKIFSDFTNKVSEEEAFNLLGESLDTPAFDEEEISTICSIINCLDEWSVPVVASHHNILPQAIPRLSIYTEVLNSGLVRSRFAKSSHPVIYCHGHIHDSPVELIKHPSRDYSLLVSISAPSVETGFNVISIEYNRNNIPLGCIIKPYRIETDGEVEEQDEIRVCFVENKSDLTLLHENLKTLSNNLDADQILPFDKLRNTLKEKGINLQKKTLADLLLEAEWIGIVEIVDKQERSDRWRIRRI